MASAQLSTFDREMQDAAFRKKFNKEYKEFLLSEIINALRENDARSVRQLAKEVGLSPTVIQKLCSGKQEDVKLSNFIHISNACGYNIILENGKNRIFIGAVGSAAANGL